MECSLKELEGSAAKRELLVDEVVGEQRASAGFVTRKKCPMSE
jgi:hypothetical protein